MSLTIPVLRPGGRCEIVGENVHFEVGLHLSQTPRLLGARSLNDFSEFDSSVAAVEGELIQIPQRSGGASAPCFPSL